MKKNNVGTWFKKKKNISFYWFFFAGFRAFRRDWHGTSTESRGAWWAGSASHWDVQALLDPWIRQLCTRIGWLVPHRRLRLLRYGCGSLHSRTDQRLDPVQIRRLHCPDWTGESPAGTPHGQRRMRAATCVKRSNDYTSLYHTYPRVRGRQKSGK